MASIKLALKKSPYSMFLLGGTYNSLMKIKSSLRKKGQFFDPLIKEKISSTGLATIENFLTDKDVQALNKALDLFTSKNKANEIHPDDSRWYSIQKEFPEINKLMVENDIIRDNLFGYLGATADFRQVMYNIINFHPQGQGSGQGWHRDSIQPQMKAMLYLSDVSHENGPFSYIPGSHHPYSILHSLQSLEDEALGWNGLRMSESQVESVRSKLAVQIEEVVAPKGTLVLFDTRILHQGKKLEKGSRRALTTYYSPPALLA